MAADRKFIMPLMLLFAVCVILLISLTTWLESINIDRNVLLIANSLFFFMSMLIFFIQRKALQNPNPNVFIRTVMAGMMVKMLACIAAIIAYIFLSGESFNKPAVFASMLLYLVYLAVEVSVSMKLNKEKNA